MGGDEFAVILNGENSREDAVRLAEKVLVRLATPITIDQHTVHVGASIGLCFFPGDANNIEDMLNNVDKALYKAKTLGKNQVCLHEQVLKSSDRTAERIRLDCESVANHHLNRLLDKPG